MSAELHTPTEICYFAALIDGIRIIDEYAKERRVPDHAIDVEALITYTQSKGQALAAMLEGEQSNERARIANVAAVVRNTRRCSFGRRGLPQVMIEAMISEYRRTQSLAKTAATFGRTRQSMWQILRRRIQLRPTYSRQLDPVYWNGEKFTPGKSGYLRRTKRTGGENQLNRLVWIKHHGPIPAGCQIMFRDGDRQHCDISNLFCVSRAEARRGKHSMNAWTKFYRGDRDRPNLSDATRDKLVAAHRRIWARYTPEQKFHRLRGIHRRWRERELIAA